jgi:hypothetical protein
MPTIQIGVTANSSSAGQPVDFDAEFVGSCVITNASGVTLAYSTGGGFTSVASGASATIGGFDARSFKLRKVASDSYPAAVTLNFEPGQGLTGAQLESLKRTPTNSGEMPQRAFLLSDSLTMRAHRAVAAAAFSRSAAPTLP